MAREQLHVAPVHWEEAKVETALSAAHLESCYRRSLESILLDSPAGASALDHQDSAPPSLTASMAADTEAAAIQILADRLPTILISPSASLWGVGLVEDTTERKSLLAAFLRAREWDIEEADAFLRETVEWRRREEVDGLGAVESDDAAPGLGFPDDAIRTIDDGSGPDGQPRTIVILAMGKIRLEALRDVEAFVAWRIRMQERACQALSSHWAVAPKGPKYTLVLDCRGLRPYHFGRACHKALKGLTHVCTHYYPDFVGDTLVINAPGFLRAAWGVAGPLMPAWWGVRIGQLSDIGLADA